MSYKKFNDLQNLYEGVVSESNEIDEYTELVYNVIIAEMVYRGHSESVIETYLENISEEQILEKVESFFSLEEYNLNEEQTDLLFSFYQDQQLISESGGLLKFLDKGKHLSKLKNLKNVNVLKNIKGSGAKLKNMIMSLVGKGKGSTKQLKLDLKGAKDGPGLLQKLKNLKTSTGNKLKDVRKGFDKKVTKTSDTLLGPDGKPLKTTKTVNPINVKNAAIAGGLGVVGGAATLTGGDKKGNKNVDKANDMGVLTPGGTSKKSDNTEVKKDDGLSWKDMKDGGLLDKNILDKKEPKVVPGSEKIIKAKWANPSGKQLPKARNIGFDKGQVNPNSARGQMIARNKEIFGGKEIEKLRNKNAAFQAAKKSGSNYSMKDFVKDFPDSNAAKDARKSKRVTSVMDMESYDAYDLVLDYIMETEQASSIEEANYIMIEMDQNTIHEIVEAQKKTLSEWKGKAAAGAVLAIPWALSELEKRWNPIKNKRKEYQNKKATEYENKSGTTKEDGYFR